MAYPSDPNDIRNPHSEAHRALRHNIGVVIMKEAMENLIAEMNRLQAQQDQLNDQIRALRQPKRSSKDPLPPHLQQSEPQPISQEPEELQQLQQQIEQLNKEIDQLIKDYAALQHDYAKFAEDFADELDAIDSFYEDVSEVYASSHAGITDIIDDHGIDLDEESRATISTITGPIPELKAPSPDGKFDIDAMMGGTDDVIVDRLYAQIRDAISKQYTQMDSSDQVNFETNTRSRLHQTTTNIRNRVTTLIGRERMGNCLEQREKITERTEVLANRAADYKKRCEAINKILGFSPAELDKANAKLDEINDPSRPSPGPRGKFGR
ncbi:MAG: hypothetical protein CMF50_03025 [Legionellales bacterium]|nr:hypothetical protein [Legionellales bacterium]|tara:strand:+ start:22852 stop:23820 length:969 start_codon:yes stop_codon:yes gene_type:complete